VTRCGFTGVTGGVAADVSTDDGDGVKPAAGTRTNRLIRSRRMGHPAGESVVGNVPVFIRPRNSLTSPPSNR
jgi:hypothetical protein